MGCLQQTTRPPAVAGTFYPEDRRTCRHEADDLLRGAGGKCPPGRWFGALVPHAGWVCSGQVAADGLTCLKRSVPDPDVIVIFGAVHTVGSLTSAALDDHYEWSLPSGRTRIHEGLWEYLLRDPALFRLDPMAHGREHSIEVQLPLIQGTWDDVPVLPIAVPPIAAAPRIGRQTAAATAQLQLSAVILASSDLTHYGPNYQQVRAGVGRQGVAWAMENDLHLLQRILRMQSDQIVDETETHLNACGGGAIAAMLAACQQLGANRAHLLTHTNSYETLRQNLGMNDPTNAVGYAAVLVGVESPE